MRSLGPVRSGRSRAAPLEEAAEKRRRPGFSSSSESTLPPLDEAFDEASHEPSDAKRDEAVASLLDILPCLEPAAAVALLASSRWSVEEAVARHYEGGSATEDQRAPALRWPRCKGGSTSLPSRGYMTSSATLSFDDLDFSSQPRLPRLGFSSASTFATATAKRERWWTLARSAGHFSPSDIERYISAMEERLKSGEVGVDDLGGGKWAFSALQEERTYEPRYSRP